MSGNVEVLREGRLEVVGVEGKEKKEVVMIRNSNRRYFSNNGRSR